MNTFKFVIPDEYDKMVEENHFYQENHVGSKTNTYKFILILKTIYTMIKDNHCNVFV